MDRSKWIGGTMALEVAVRFDEEEVTKDQIVEDINSVLDMYRDITPYELLIEVKVY